MIGREERPPDQRCADAGWRGSTQIQRCNTSAGHLHPCAIEAHSMFPVNPTSSTHIQQHGSPRGRLAPSPTGHLHIGNARSFLLAWLQMRTLGGEIILRIEDLDRARAAPGAARQIVRDLEWLGLTWDNDLTPEYFQSNRFDRYRAAIGALHRQDLLYECFCSRRELHDIANAPHGRTLHYAGNCRSLSIEERCSRRSNKSPAVRFRVSPSTCISFHDGVAGDYAEDVHAVTGDFIIARADGVPSYQLAVVLDDIAMGITHVLRGDDLLHSTPRQILLFKTFGAPIPSYTHVPLMVAQDGARLAKRHGSLSIAELRAAGHNPAAVTGWLAWSCGLLTQPEPIPPHALLAIFSVERIASEPTIVQAPILL